ncbi:MAG: alpha/beta fold hydrolase, partial [Rhodococcus sp. (in: high G+C Gram-positive bacteria)]
MSTPQAASVAAPPQAASVAAPPQWFVDALASVPTTADVEVQGTTIRTRSWGDEDAPGVLLVHGGAAHSGWWDHVAPFLARRYRVTALDLSGHGDSGRRDEYGLDVWAAEVTAVAHHSNFLRPPVVIGHSMGGWVAMAAATEDARVAGVAVVDTPLKSLSPEEVAARDKRAFGPLKIYPTRADGVA